MKARLPLLAAVGALALSLCFAACHSDSVVQWPELKQMDDWAEKGEGWAEDNKIADMRKNLPDVLKAMQTLSSSPVPANAKDPAAVGQTMSDFRDLMKQLQKPNLADDDLKASVASIHPLVEKLMGVAGLPHIHEHPEEKKEEKK